MLKYRLTTEDLFRFIDLLEKAGLEAEDVKQAVELQIPCEGLVETTRRLVKEARDERMRKHLELKVITRWNKNDYVALGSHKSLPPGIHPVAVDRSRRRAKELAIARGITTPQVVPASTLKELGEDQPTTKEEQIPITDVPPGHYVALGSSFKVVAHDVSKKVAREKAIRAGCSTPLVCMPVLESEKPLTIDDIPPGHYVALNDGLEIVCHAPSRTQAKEEAQAKGVWAPTVLSVVELRRQARERSMRIDDIPDGRYVALTTNLQLISTALSVDEVKRRSSTRGVSSPIILRGDRSKGRP